MEAVGIYIYYIYIYARGLLTHPAPFTMCIVLCISWLVYSTHTTQILLFYRLMIHPTSNEMAHKVMEVINFAGPITCIE